MIEPKPIEFRSAKVVDIHYPQRMIDLVVMPYEEEAVVEFRGRMIREVCSRGAYDGLEKRPGRVMVNRDHVDDRYVGRAVTFHPSREEGLVAEIRIHRSQLGDETLMLAEDGDLDASAGFAVGAERWLDGRQLRRLDKCFLQHIALVPDPAYLGAKVLELRGDRDPEPIGRVPTPNLDALRLHDLEERYILGR